MTTTYYAQAREYNSQAGRFIQEDYWRRMGEKKFPDFTGLDQTQLPDYTDIMQEFIDGKVKEYEAYAESHSLLETSLKFYDDVKPGGEMDIKERDPWIKQFESLPCGNFVFRGKIVDPGIMGNLTYAYLGRAISNMSFKGFNFPAKFIYSKLGLIAGGGWAESGSSGGQKWLFFLMPNFGEDPDDVETIREGYQWYDECD